jgi:hypothetical protein
VLNLNVNWDSPLDSKKFARTTVIGLICAAALVSVGFVVHRLSGDPEACISEDMKTIPDLSGVKVEVVYTNCDTLAKEESIDIYFSRVSRESWFANWRNHRALVFSYDPGRSDRPLPSVARPSDSSIVISVPEISSVIHQSRDWQDVSITYKLGKVDYPANPK